MSMAALDSKTRGCQKSRPEAGEVLQKYAVQEAQIRVPYTLVETHAHLSNVVG